MNKRKISLFIMSTIMTLCISCIPAKAFQAVGHCVLIDSIGETLPQDSIIAQAINKHPEVAHWGSYALDLGYMQPGVFLDRAPWADRFHYYKVGTFAKKQLKVALKSKDMKKIAFAAGWVSHLTGDLASHGKFVNPECGVYLHNEDTRDLHKELENNAEIYLFSKIAGKSPEDYNREKIPTNFEKINEIPFDMLNNISKQVYGQAPTKVEEKLWCNTVRGILKTGINYKYSKLEDAKKFLAENGREKRLLKAFEQAKKHGVKLLKEAENGNYSGFTDRWNLDVGITKSPIGTLTVTLTTGKKIGAGTNDDIYLTIELKNGKTKQWKLGKKNYNDFEYGATDEYYLYINDLDFHPKDIIKTYVTKKNDSYALGDWYLKNFKVDVNGIDALNKDIDKWVTNKNNTEELKINWNKVENTVDPAIDLN